MTNLKQAAERALEVLEDAADGVISRTNHYEVIADLKEAIKSSQQAAPEQAGEPDYWLSAMGDLYSSPAIAEQYGAAKPYTPLYLAAPSMLSELAPNPIPAGWQLVPIEPTTEMISAARLNGAEGSDLDLASDYKSMLSAAPSE